MLQDSFDATHVAVGTGQQRVNALGGRQKTLYVHRTCVGTSCYGIQMWLLVDSKI